MTAEEYNESKLNMLWSMLSLPSGFTGLQSLQAASDAASLSVNAQAVDWKIFSDAVGAFQEIGTAAAPDRKLGSDTMRALVTHFSHQFPLPNTNHIADPIVRLQRIAESQLGVEENTSTSEHNPRILSYAREIGYGGVQDDETAWCSIFANWCALKAGLPYSGKLNARSWLDVGTSTTQPQPGDVVVFWRDSPNSWTGHVAFYVGHGNGVINVLGGNQANRVCVMAYRSDRLLGYRRLT